MMNDKSVEYRFFMVDGVFGQATQNISKKVIQLRIQSTTVNLQDFNDSFITETQNSLHILHKRRFLQFVVSLVGLEEAHVQNFIREWSLHPDTVIYQQSHDARIVFCYNEDYIHQGNVPAFLIVESYIQYSQSQYSQPQIHYSQYIREVQIKSQSQPTTQIPSQHPQQIQQSQQFRESYGQQIQQFQSQQEQDLGEEIRYMVQMEHVDSPELEYIQQQIQEYEDTRTTKVSEKYNFDTKLSYSLYIPPVPWTHQTQWRSWMPYNQPQTQTQQQPLKKRTQKIYDEEVYEKLKRIREYFTSWTRVPRGLILSIFPDWNGDRRTLPKLRMSGRQSMFLREVFRERNGYFQNEVKDDED